MEIRRAHPTEAATLTAIAVAAKRHWHYAEALMRLWSDSLRVTPARIEQQAIYVATVDDEVIGFYALIPTTAPEVYELDDLWIRPDSIGQGIGRQLFAHAAAFARAQGGTTLQLVAEPNALGFYQKMGMSKVGERTSQPPGRVLDVMALPL